MRIVSLIAVGAFLLSNATAESNVPIGASQYQQRPRPIILEPVMKIKSNNEDNPLNWFIKMVSRVMEEPKKPSPPPMIGPINIPGMGGQVYIRQVESNLMPWESNHIVIKMVTRDPVTGNTVPIDSPSHYHHPEDYSRRAVKPFGYQSKNNAALRPNNNMMQPSFVPVSPQPHYSSWHAQQPYQQNTPQYSKPFRASTPNDFRYDNYAKEADQGYAKGHPEDYSRINYHRFNPGVAQPLNAVPLPSMYRSVAQQTPNPDPVYSSNIYNDRFKDIQDNVSQGQAFYANSGKPDSPIATQMPHPQHPGSQELQPVTPTKGDNVSHIEHTSAGPFINSVRYRQVGRVDRMVPAVGYQNNLRNVSRESKARESKSRGFREGTKFDTKFDAGDVGGIEVIAAPNLQGGWGDYSNGKSVEDDNLSSDSSASDSGLNQDEDSISMGNGRNLARGESAEHSDEQLESENEKRYVPVSRSAQSRRSYRIIDRSHRSQGSQRQSDSTETNNSREISRPERIKDRKNVLVDEKFNGQGVEEASSQVERNARMSKVTAEAVQKVMNLTASNRWQMQGRRTPRVVKAIYRRKPVAGIVRSSAETMESSGSSDEKTLKESLSFEN